MPDNDAYRELPFRPKGWRFRYLFWDTDKQGSPSFAPGSVVLWTGMDERPPHFFRMVWLEPVECSQVGITDWAQWAQWARHIR